MSSTSVKVNTYALSPVAAWLTAAPVNSDTWTILEHLGDQELAKPQDVDAGQEANPYGLATNDYPTIKGGGFPSTTRIYTGTKGNDGAGSDTDPTSCYGQTRYESYFGMAAGNAFKGTTVAGTSGPGFTTPLKVTSASNLVVGMGIFVGAVGGSVGEYATITNISGTDVTLDHDIVAANYASGSIIYGGFNFYPNLGEPAAYQYLTHTKSTGQDMIGASRVTSLKLSGLDAAAGMRLEAAFQADRYYAGSGEGAVVPSAVVANAFSGSPLVAVGGQAMINSVARALQGASVDFPCKFDPIDTSSTAGAAQSRAGIMMSSMDGGSFDFETLYASGDWTLHGSRAPVPMSLAHHVPGTNVQQARGAIYVYCPGVQMMVEGGARKNQRTNKVKGKMVGPTAAQIALGLTKSCYVTVFGGV